MAGAANAGAQDNTAAAIRLANRAMHRVGFMFSQDFAIQDYIDLVLGACGPARYGNFTALAVKAARRV